MALFSHASLSPMQLALLIIFLFGYVVTVLVGTGTGGGAASVTETNMLFQWPGYLILAGVAVLTMFRWRMRLKHAPCDLCLLVGAILVAYICWRGLDSPVYKARMDISLALASFIAFALSASMFSLPAYRRAWFVVSMLLLVANFAVVLVHLSGNYSYLPHPSYERSSAARAGGFFIDPNHLGTFMNISLFPALGLAFFGKGGVMKRLLLFFLVALAVVGIGGASSRGSFIALLGGLGAFTVSTLVLSFRIHRQAFGKILTSVLLGAGGLVAIVFFMAQKLMTARFANGELSLGEFEHRKWYWWAAYEQFCTSKIFGTGARTYDTYWREFFPPGRPAHLSDARFAHSEYLQMLGDYGLVGMCLLLFLVILCIVHGNSFLRWFSRTRYPSLNEATNDNLGLTIGALAAITSVAIAAIFEFPLHIPAIAIPTAVLLGILANPGFERLGYKPIQLGFGRLFVKLGVILSGVVLLYWGTRYLPAEHYFEESRFAEGNDVLGLQRIGLLNKAKEHDPYNPVLHYHGGAARMHMMRDGMPPPVIASIASKARADLKAAVDLYPRDIFPRMLYVDCLDILNDIEEADRIATGTISLAPFHRNALISYAHHAVRLGRWDEAEAYYRSSYWAGYTENGGTDGGALEYLRQQRAKEAEASSSAAPQNMPLLLPDTTPVAPVPGLMQPSPQPLSPAPLVPASPPVVAPSPGFPTNLVPATPPK